MILETVSEREWKGQGKGGLVEPLDVERFWLEIGAEGKAVH